MFSKDIPAEICKALGLDPAKTQSIVINIKPQEAVTVDVVLLVDTETEKHIASVLKRYALVSDVA